MISPSEVAAAGGSRSEEVASTVYSPAEAVRLIHAAVARSPEQVVAITQAACKVTPSLALFLTTAAVYTVPHRAAEIARAVIALIPGQANQVRITADTAGALARHPSQRRAIIQSRLAAPTSRIQSRISNPRRVQIPRARFSKEVPEEQAVRASILSLYTRVWV
jgi:hypothetical protein